MLRLNWMILWVVFVDCFKSGHLACHYVKQKMNLLTNRSLAGSLIADDDRLMSPAAPFTVSGDIPSKS